MDILGLTTSSAHGSVSVFRGGRFFTQAFESSLLNHSSQLIPSIQKILKEAGIFLSQVKSVAVDVGPGSFTGIRMAIATAEALALTGIKSIGLSSLDIMAEDVTRYFLKSGKDEKEFIIAIDAGRQEFYMARYIASSGKKVFPDALVSERDLIKHSSPCPLYGHLQRKNKSFSARDRMQVLYPSSESLIALAVKRMNEKTGLLMPNYIRAPHVILKRK
ncbi:MAG: tRNA (adenosine(37)-N6)-threonylcarbamoyltransferase complex dimerization subunit type 1 TsaB [Candidatus Aureabacteria bacterium]|nr:tRNA (adenosine(37)-N6)-threonylcarbamoyltransferase complex dimerization subunit type 1 TsaB [Candidatus Auribacterota bacterium]